MEVKRKKYRGAGISGILNGRKSTAVRGIIILMPFLVTLLVVSWLLGMVARIPGLGFLELTSYFYINQAVKLSVLFVAGSFLTVVLGRFARTGKGVKAEELLDNGINRIPFIRMVYSTAKKTTDTVLRGPDGFGRPVKIDLGGIRLTGFKTGNRTVDGHNVVFIPTSPNVTSGFVVEIEEKWVQGTDETVTDAITTLLSAGFGRETDFQPPIEEDKEKVETTQRR